MNRIKLISHSSIPIYFLSFSSELGAKLIASWGNKTIHGIQTWSFETFSIKHESINLLTAITVYADDKHHKTASYSWEFSNCKIFMGHQIPPISTRQWFWYSQRYASKVNQLQSSANVSCVSMCVKDLSLNEEFQQRFSIFHSQRFVALRSENFN